MRTVSENVTGQFTEISGWKREKDRSAGFLLQLLLRMPDLTAGQVGYGRKETDADLTGLAVQENTVLVVNEIAQFEPAELFRDGIFRQPGRYDPGENERSQAVSLAAMGDEVPVFLVEQEVQWSDVSVTDFQAVGGLIADAAEKLSAEGRDDGLKGIGIDRSLADGFGGNTALEFVDGYGQGLGQTTDQIIEAVSQRTPGNCVFQTVADGQGDQIILSQPQIGKLKTAFGVSVAPPLVVVFDGCSEEIPHEGDFPTGLPLGQLELFLQFLQGGVPILLQLTMKPKVPFVSQFFCHFLCPLWMYRYNDNIFTFEVAMKNDRTKMVRADNGMTRDMFDFGSPDETLNEMETEANPSGTSSIRSGQLRLNRHFLEDAAPFELEGIGQALEASVTRLQLNAEPEWSMPLSSLVLVRGGRGSGKSCLLMNLMWRMSELYPEHHLLYYSFERTKPEVFLRLILLGGQVALPGKEGLDEQLQEWRKLLLTEDPESLKKRSASEASMSGLAYLLQQGYRIHVVDRLTDIDNVENSLETFARSLPLSVAFIDGGDWLLHAGETVDGHLTLNRLLAKLRRKARFLGITIVLSLSDDFGETNGSSTLYEAVAGLNEPWGGGSGTLLVDWQEPAHHCRIEVPMMACNQRFIWNRLREAVEIE